jgi:glutaredoxin
MRKMQAALVLLGLVAALGYAQSNVYRWTDKDGKVHFTDTPPPDDARDAVQKRMGGGGPDDASLPYATQMAARRNPVSLFTSSDCGDPCASARDLLEKRGVPYTERNPMGSKADLDELKSISGDLFVPTLVVGASNVKGFDEGRWNSALDSAGYLRTKLPSQGSMRREPPPGAKPDTPGK